MAKYIVVTGGVLSSVGKGIVAASLGKMLQVRGVQVAIQKLDPYINVDPGTMSPYQHGEVFVTDDGAETDLDLGHYERFLNINLNAACSVSAGQIYARVIDKERKGDFLGGTIQVIPHITDEIKVVVKAAAQKAACDVLVVEVGGTVGDLEVGPFLEALRQLQGELDRGDLLFVHVAWLPYVQATQELKTKPAQHSLRELRSIGIIPDFVVARADQTVDQALCDKIGLFGNVAQKNVIPLATEKTIYKVPLLLESYGVGDKLVQALHLQEKVHNPDWISWKNLIASIEKAPLKTVTIGLVGKYVQLHDAYISVTESLKHAACQLGVSIKVEWIDAQEVTPETVDGFLKGCDAVLIPGGFGQRAVEGKIVAARWARENKKPYLGLCLGMQVLCIELARARIDAKAHSTEINPATPLPVISLMESQKDVQQKGASMRLGVYPCVLAPGTKAYELYKKYGQSVGEDNVVLERHRHRFEFNNNYKTALENEGLVISGVSPDGKLVELVEIKGHPFMVASQFHPELLSRPELPHPLFVAFIESIQK